MRVLVTNDDGVFSPGLASLALAACAEDHEVTIAAPLEDCSGSGAAVGPVHLTGRIGYEPVALAGLEHLATYGVEGPPALAVLCACLGGFGPQPDAVLSGVNAGANTGRAVLHSGTVGAALTGANFGLPSVAVSAVAGVSPRWELAAVAGLAVLPWLARVRPAAVLNVNAPSVEPWELQGVRAAPLAGVGTVQAAVDGLASGSFELTLPVPGPAPPGTDAALVAEGYVVLTLLQGVRPVGDVALNAPRSLVERAVARRQVRV